VAAREAATRASVMVGILRAGRDLDLPALNTRLARQLRQGYADVWRTWAKIDLECRLGWGLEIEDDPGGARAFDIERWWIEVGSRLSEGVESFNTLLSSIELRTRRARSFANKSLNAIALEATRTAWAMAKEY
jgi:hypothetical protein